MIEQCTIGNTLISYEWYEYGQYYQVIMSGNSDYDYKECKTLEEAKIAYAQFCANPIVD